MAQHAAVHGGEQGFQRVVLPAQLLLIGPLPGYVDANAHGAHDAAVQVVQGGLIGGQQPGPLAGLDGFLRHAGFLRLHDDPLGLDADGVVKFHVPDVSVPLALDLLLGLVHRLAEAVVYLFVDAVLGFVPDQVGHAVDGGLQVLPCLPEILLLVAGPQPFLEAEAQLLSAHGQGPQIGQGGEQLRQLGQLIPQSQHNQLRPALRQGPDGSGGVQPREVGEDHVGLGGQGGIRLPALQKRMGKRLLGSGLLKRGEKLQPAADAVEPQMTMIHKRSPPYGCGFQAGPRGRDVPPVFLNAILTGKAAHVNHG